MNDFERKLSQQPFRTPPGDLRAAVLATAEKVVAVPPWTWRDWLWPSPMAWGALAAVWIVCAAVQVADRPTAPSVAVSARSLPESELVALLLATRNSPDFGHVLDSDK